MNKEISLHPFFGLLIFTFFGLQLHASTPAAVDTTTTYPELTKFAEKYRCSPEVEKEALEEHVQHKGRWTKDNKFFIKSTQEDDGIARIVNAQRLKNYLAKKGLDRIEVTEKCLSSNLQHVIATGVPNVATPPKISLHETKQLAQLAEETGFTDWGGALVVPDGRRRWPTNVLRNTQGKFVLIDTEDKSFQSYFHDHPIQLIKIRLEQLINFCDQKSDPTAQQWLEKRAATLQKTPYGATTPIELWNNPQYNDTEIDFEQVKKEFKQKIKTEFYQTLLDEQKKHNQSH